MPSHYDTPTVCTCSFLGEWSQNGLYSGPEKDQVNRRLTLVNDLIHKGYKRDFKQLLVIITEEQRSSYKIDNLLKEIGFTNVFTAEPHSRSRERDSGALYTWMITPEDYEEGLQKLRKDLTIRKDVLDPPKKPDPARQKIEDLKLHHLRTAGLVFDNAKVNNPLFQVLEKDVDENKVWMFLQGRFGCDFRKLKGIDWTKLTIRQLKEAHVAWKAELV